MTRRTAQRAIAGMMMLVLSTSVVAASVPPVELEPASVHAFEDEPAPWRAYFEAVRQAEQHEDALERCLAYPDLPGNKWPAGYAVAHCHYHFGVVPTVAEVDALVSKGELATLEKRVHALMAMHDRSGPARESVHQFFQQFSEVPEEGLRVTAQWVEQAPDSAAAAVARASALKGAGWKVRGEKWSRDTPATQLQAMSSYFDQAEAAFRKASDQEPGWVYPYIGLMDIGKADRDEAGEWAFAKANALDPGCAEIVYRRMQSLQPRWGGSWVAMEAYAKKIAPYVEQRPLLVNQLSEPLVDFASMLEAEQRGSAEATAMLEHAVELSAFEKGLRLAASALINPAQGSPDHRRGAAMLLQESRFQPIDGWAGRSVGIYLLDFDPDWALEVLRRAMEAEPSNAVGRYYLGAAYSAVGDFEEAEGHYIAASDSPELLPHALSGLASMWLLDSNLEPATAAAKARPSVERLLKADPRNVDGLYLRIVLKAASPGGALDQQAIEDYLEVADANDPDQADRRAGMLDVLNALKSGAKSIRVEFN